MNTHQYSRWQYVLSLHQYGHKEEESTQFISCLYALQFNMSAQVQNKLIVESSKLLCFFFFGDTTTIVLLALYLWYRHKSKSNFSIQISAS